MSETFPEGTSQGTDYGSTTDRLADLGGNGDGDRTEGAAVPDEPEAERAQEGVQESFE